MPNNIVEIVWQRRLTLNAIACSLSELKCLAAEVRLERAMRRYGRALKYGYNPAQPLVPKGEDGAGEWTGEGAGGRQESRKPPVAEKPVKLAGDITGFTRHGINQTINRGVPPAAIHDAVANPIRIIPRSNGTTQYVGKDAVIVLNPAGGVVTVWPR